MRWFDGETKAEDQKVGQENMDLKSGLQASICGTEVLMLAAKIMGLPRLVRPCAQFTPRPARDSAATSHRVKRSSFVRLSAMLFF